MAWIEWNWIFEHHKSLFSQGRRISSAVSILLQFETKVSQQASYVPPAFRYAPLPVAWIGQRLRGLAFCRTLTCACASTGATQHLPFARYSTYTQVYWLCGRPALGCARASPGHWQACVLVFSWSALAYGTSTLKIVETCDNIIFPFVGVFNMAL